MIKQKKIVLVTGGSSGIGKAVAEYLALNGFIVYGTSRSERKEEKASGVKMLKVDVTDEESILSAISEIKTRHGALDVLINNAGLGMAGPIESTSAQEVEEIFNTNVFGVFNVCRAAIPLMRDSGGGNIINITSIAGHFGLPYRGIYCSSKFAVEGFSESLSMEIKKFGIEVSIIEPGDFKTSINQNRRLAQNVDEKTYPNFRSALNQVNREVENAQDPILIAHKIEKIVKTKKPSLYYQVGTPVQKLSIFLKRILPSRTFERMIMKHYKMNTRRNP